MSGHFDHEISHPRVHLDGQGFGDGGARAFVANAQRAAVQGSETVEPRPFLWKPCIHRHVVGSRELVASTKSKAEKKAPSNDGRDSVCFESGVFWVFSDWETISLDGAPATSHQTAGRSRARSNSPRLKIFSEVMPCCWRSHQEGLETNAPVFLR